LKEGKKGRKNTKRRHKGRNKGRKRGRNNGMNRGGNIGRKDGKIVPRLPLPRRYRDHHHIVKITTAGNPTR
jgi:hypothetical protein